MDSIFFSYFREEIVILEQSGGFEVSKNFTEIGNVN